MTIDLIVDEAETTVATFVTDTFLNFEGEVGLSVNDCFLEGIATLLDMGFDSYDLEADDVYIQSVSENPEMQLHPADLAVTDGFSQLAVTDPELSLGPLPRGLSLIDNGNGTAFIVGTPAPGTAGDYEVNIAANNGVNPNAELRLTIKVRD